MTTLRPSVLWHPLIESVLTTSVIYVPWCGFDWKLPCNTDKQQTLSTRVLPSPHPPPKQNDLRLCSLFPLGKRIHYSNPPKAVTSTGEADPETQLEDGRPTNMKSLQPLVVVSFFLTYFYWTSRHESESRLNCGFCWRKPTPPPTAITWDY